MESEVLAVGGLWMPVEFLVDTGADRTVFSAEILRTLALPHLPVSSQLGGVGGMASTVAVGTHIRLSLGGGATIAFQGTFAGFTDPASLDMSVLGRDIMNLFAVVVDGPGDLVCMVGKGHRYTIT